MRPPEQVCVTLNRSASPRNNVASPNRSLRPPGPDRVNKEQLRGAQFEIAAPGTTSRRLIFLCVTRKNFASSRNDDATARTGLRRLEQVRGNQYSYASSRRIMRHPGTRTRPLELVRVAVNKLASSLKKIATPCSPLRPLEECRVSENRNAASRNVTRRPGWVCGESEVRIGQLSGFASASLRRKLQ
jgi:hypothetical protein